MATTRYITTPIYYPNAKPHLGSAYTTTLADVLARFCRSAGYNTFFLTGLDEHGEKLQRAAEAKGIHPKAFVDEMATQYLDAWQTLKINYDFFIRTSEEYHKKGVEKIFMLLYDNGDIYKGTYEGYYCVGCERYFTENELVDGKCPYHDKPVEERKIDAYFFRLSKYREKLLSFYEQNPSFLPPNRKQEIINRLEKLNDLCISRPKSQVWWGVELPFDKEHVSYVWVDALFNYATGIGYGRKDEGFKTFWPPDVHFVGKDILWFHAVIWPALLMSCGFELPKRIACHGFITVKEMKMSKSLGNVVDPVEMVKKYGVDALRYFLVVKMSMLRDSDFSEEALKTVYNEEIASNIGNLINRVVVLLNKTNVETETFTPSQQLADQFNSTLKALKDTLDANDPYAVLENRVKEAVALFATLNIYLSEKEPWKQEEEEKQQTLLNAMEGVLIASTLLYPVLIEGMGSFHRMLKTTPTIETLQSFGGNVEMFGWPKQPRCILYPRVD